MDRKSVLIYCGPPASGKTTQMRKLAEMRGIHFRTIIWHELKLCPQLYWRYLEKDAEGVDYLFIDDYDLADTESNFYLHELSLVGIMIVIASQTEITNQISEGLPSSFRITRCKYQVKEVSHA
jgi:guanylate kinase